MSGKRVLLCLGGIVVPFTRDYLKLKTDHHSSCETYNVCQVQPLATIGSVLQHFNIVVTRMYQRFSLTSPH